MVARFYTFIILIVSCCGIRTAAQDTAARAVRPEFAVSGFYYIIPAATNTASVIATADYKNWHGELRYNYEDVRTASFFAGKTFAFGRKLQVSLTPLIGIVAGQTNAVAPGLETQLEYSILDFYAESEYVFDFRGRESNFYYVWSELGVSPFKTLRAGITVQRTKLYKTRFDVQKGIFGSYGIKDFKPSVYYFNPGSAHHFFVFALEYTF